jgi:uncharacterized protein YbbC (DUF1343 family)
MTHFARICLCCLLLLSACGPRKQGSSANKQDTIIKVLTGADVLIQSKLHQLRGKRIAVVANQTALLQDNVHLVDALKAKGIQVVKIFAPEHGFRGQAEAGQKIDNYTDSLTGLPVFSLYGKRTKPTLEELADVDLVIFDIQDVGARFYTYISTLSLLMDACSEAGKPLWVLDRPNPNGDQAAGPVLDTAFRSFVGMHPVPILHGLTIGEYARMVKGEGWNGADCDLTIVGMQGYRRGMTWEETDLAWTAPSPNLPTLISARLYPGLCLAEGTLLSVGRGTNYPFQILGAPWQLAMRYRWKKDSIAKTKTDYRVQGVVVEPLSFIPRSIAGKAFHPPYEGLQSWGYHLRSQPKDAATTMLLGLELIQRSLNEYRESRKLQKVPIEPFFNDFFPKLAGNLKLQQQLERGDSPEQIAQTWIPVLTRFKQMSERYRLYKHQAN